MAKTLIGFVYDEIFLDHLVPENHPESSTRLEAILTSLNQSSIKNNLVRIKPRRASIEELSLAHDKNYIRELNERKFEGFINRDKDTYFSLKTFDVASFAAGAVLTAIDLVKSSDLKFAFCAVRPPGHHAERNKAEGFCIFNNVAIGSRYAQRQKFQKIFIVDFDAHHGNGTQHIFEQENTIFYFSTHVFPDYPGTGKSSEHGIGLGKGFTCNIPLAAGSGDTEYATIYRGLLPKLVENFHPDLILVSAGYDIHRDDPLTKLNVSDEGIREVSRSIIQIATSISVPAIFVLEGGYNLSVLGRGVVATLEEMKHY